MEALWFIALSTATSRTCALACRMNTALSVLSIRHHHLSPPPPRSHTLPFHGTIHKQYFIILIPSSPYLFSARNVGPWFYVPHYFWCISLSRAPWRYFKMLSIDFNIMRIKFVSTCLPDSNSDILSNWINVLHTIILVPKRLAYFLWKVGLVIWFFHSYRHAESTGTSHWEGCTLSNYGRILLLLFMLLSRILQNGWLSCVSVGHVILLKAFMVLGLCYWNVT